MTRFRIFFPRKNAFIKVLGLGSPTTDLWIQPLNSRLATVELFPSSSRTPQNLRRNGLHSTVQMADQSSSKNTLLTIAATPRFYNFLFVFFVFTLFSFLFKTHFILFFNPPTTTSPRPNIQKPIELIFCYSICFVSFPIHFIFHFF